MNFRRFNQHGLDCFRQVIADRRIAFKAKRSVEPIPSELLESPEFTSSTIYQLPHLRPVFASKYDVCNFIFHSIPLQEYFTVREDPYLWSWIAGFYYDEITNRRKKIKEDRAYVAGITFKEAYRHLILGPCFVFSTALDKPERVRVLLYDEPTTMNEVMVQLGSYLDYLKNPTVQTMVQDLYWDASRGRTKRGSGGKGAGTPRRFMEYLHQIELNYDLRSTTAATLLSILPREFHKFRTPF